MWRKIPWSVVTPVAVLLAAVFWSLWPVLAGMAERWSGDPRYAHGYLVPVFSLTLLWMRRKQFLGENFRPSTWGLAFIAMGAAIQLVGAYFLTHSIEGFAFLAYLAGLALLAGGWPAFQWSWPSILFLLFMIPLPWRLEKALGPTLQDLATQSSTFLLQTFGFMAFSQGNVIQLNEYRIGVVEACSGLSMLITFIALSTGMALVLKRPLLDKIVLVLSAIPVALMANIARITLTGILHETIGRRGADTFYHDLAGWVMIPFALLLYWGVIWIFSHLLIEVGDAPVLVGVSSGGARQVMAPPSRVPKPAAAHPRPRRGR